MGSAVPISEWQPDASSNTCTARDCGASFASLGSSFSSPPPLGSSNARPDPADPPSSSIFGGLTSILTQPFAARRHHCRACGKIFCSSHSAQTLPLLFSTVEQADSERAKSTASGAASPLLSLAGFTRRGSTPAGMLSGTSGPSPVFSSPRRGSSPYFDISKSSSPTKSESAAPSNLVAQARVCDDCHISLTVAASLAGLEIPRHSLSSPSGAFSPKSGLPSTQPSPQGSQTLSPGRQGSLGASSSSFASMGSNSVRTRQESASTTASSSGISISGVQTARSSPPTSTDVSPSALMYKPGNATRLALPEYRGQTTQVQSKDQPAGMSRRVYQLSAVGAGAPMGQQRPPVGSSDTPEDNSFPSTIGSTPGQGWTWST